MPTKSELPPDLATLPEYHALTLDNAIWQVGIDRLLRSITPSGSLNKSPILALPTDAVTFDTVGRGDPSPDRSVSLTNRGVGALNATVVHELPWFNVVVCPD